MQRRAWRGDDGIFTVLGAAMCATAQRRVFCRVTFTSNEESSGNAIMLKIDDVTASKLYLECQRDVLSAKSCKEIPAVEKTKLVVLGVSCVVEFGFCFNKYSSRPGIHACVWIFSPCGEDYLSSSYQHVQSEIDARAILNSTICIAIERAKATSKFESLQAISTSHPTAVALSVANSMV
jgi:hypothetical protein